MTTAIARPTQTQTAQPEQRGRLTWAVSDALVLAKRHLRHIPRNPELLVFECPPEANVFPMVPSGAAISEMMLEEE